MPEFALVLAPGEDGAALELATVLRDELMALGEHAELSWGFPPPREDLVHVLPAPLSYYRREGLEIEPAWQLLKRSAFVCIEPPGSAGFDDEAFLGQRAGVVFHVNRPALEHLRRRGVAGAQHFALGWTDGWTNAVDERDIDLLVHGRFSDNRARHVAANGPWAWDRRSVVWLPEGDQPRPDLLRRARVVLNLHRDEGAALEWLPVAQAICAGCAVVSEHAIDYEPLEPGEHILLARAENLALLARGLLDDEERRRRLADAAAARLRERQPLRAAAAALAAAAAELAAAPLPPGGRRARFRKRNVELDPAPPDPYPTVVADAPSSAGLAALKATRLDLLQLGRRVSGIAVRQAGVDADELEEGPRSSAYDATEPGVSIVIPLYNHSEHVVEALDSVAALWSDDVELVVTDDGSSDSSFATVSDWIERNPGVAARIVRHRVNRGLGAARNTAIGLARGANLLFLDADNVLYPNALQKLGPALASDAQAVLSYGILEMFATSGPVGLRSYLDWDPQRFRSRNYVDALALVRRDWVQANGGFVTDPRLHGWEDYDLWCRLAAMGGHGVFVPEIVARYRSSPHSMLSLTDLSSRQAVGLLAERYPDLFAGVELPL